MLNPTKLYLSGLAYELGDFYDITNVEGLKENPNLLKTLLMLGLKNYSQSNLTTSELAQKSIQKTLKNSDTLPDSVDFLVYATNTFWDLGSGVNGSGLPEVARVIDSLGLKNAYPIGVNLSECGNLHTALRIAAALLRNEDLNNALIVTADINDNSKRILSGTMSVLSDGAASVLLTKSEEKADFEIIGTGQYMDAAVRYLDPTTEEFMIRTAEGVKKTVEVSLSKFGKERNDFQRLITNCYNMSVSNTFCSLLDFKISDTYTKNIAKFAHAWSADNIINLHDFSIEQPFSSGEAAMLIGTGSCGWGCSLLAKV